MKASRSRTEMKGASRAGSEMKQARDAFLRGKPRSRVPHEFVLDALEPIGPVTKPMFGCLAVYVRERIVLILRDHRDHPADNGVWLATTAEHHESLRREFPHMRSLQLFGTPVTSWQVLPSDAGDFEESALRACELVLARDPRIGKVPGRRTVTRKTGTATMKSRTAKKKTKTATKKR
jgi:hypothetical protein